MRDGFSHHGLLATESHPFLSQISTEFGIDGAVASGQHQIHKVYLQLCLLVSVLWLGCIVLLKLLRTVCLEMCLNNGKTCHNSTQGTQLI